MAALKTEKDKIALELKIQSSLLATNAELEALVSAWPRDRAALEATDLLLPWQTDILAESFLKILNAP